MKKALALFALIALASIGLSRCDGTTVYAQSLPATVKFGVTPDPAVSGYTVALDGGAAVDVHLPATSASCVDYFSGATTTCVPLPVVVPSYGAHSLAIVAYITPDPLTNNLGGPSAPTVVTFKLGPANAASGKFIK